MVLETFLESYTLLPLPAHITLTLLFSFLIWSKFLKNGRLQIKNVKDLMDILSIFIMLFFFINSTYFISSIFLYRNDVQYAFSNVPETVTSAYISLLIILSLFLVGARDVKLNRNDLNKVAFYITYLFIVIYFFTIGFQLAVLQTNTWNIFLGRTNKLMEFSSIIPFVYVFFYLSGFFSEQNKKSYGDFKHLKNFVNSLPSRRRLVIILSIVLFASIPIGFLMGNFMIPAVESVENPPTHYELKGEKYNGLAYEFVERSYVIKKEGFLLDLISLNYSGLSFDGTPSFSINYGYISEENRAYSSQLHVQKQQSGVIFYGGKDYRDYGIEDFRVQNETNSIIVRVDKDKLKNMNVSNFIVRGKREKNISNDFIVETSREVKCPKGNCSINIGLVNNLKHQIMAGDISLVGPGTYIYYGRCQVGNISGIAKKNDKIGQIEFMYLDMESYRFGSLGVPDFSLGIRPQRLHILGVDNFRIGGETEVNLQLTLLCE